MKRQHSSALESLTSLEVKEVGWFCNTAMVQELLTKSREEWLQDAVLDKAEIVMQPSSFARALLAAQWDWSLVRKAMTLLRQLMASFHGKVLGEEARSAKLAIAQSTVGCDLFSQPQEPWAISYFDGRMNCKRSVASLKEAWNFLYAGMERYAAGAADLCLLLPDQDTFCNDRCTTLILPTITVGPRGMKLSRPSLWRKVDALADKSAGSIISAARELAPDREAHDSGYVLDVQILEQALDPRYVDGRFRAEVLWILNIDVLQRCKSDLEEANTKSSYTYASAGFKAICDIAIECVGHLCI